MSTLMSPISTIQRQSTVPGLMVLLVNFTVGVTLSTPPVDRCDLWDRLMESLQRSNGAIGGGSLNVASDVDLLDPCANQFRLETYVVAQFATMNLVKSALPTRCAAAKKGRNELLAKTAADQWNHGISHCG
uniref:Uncharacterized protein n=1 Tax=Ditylenchus dipsaci TaxID=166011 RepID=A0A915D2B3_9BILA